MFADGNLHKAERKELMSAPFSFQSLTDVEISVAFACFQKAFSDYFVQMD
jgi:hypothetical protein